MNTQTLAISGISIRQDSNGRFCLNDLHKAAGGEKKYQPANWLRTQQTIELVAFLESEERVHKPLEILQGGSLQGTFAIKELVYAYATWISAKFFLTVIRAYDSLVNSVPYGLKDLAPVTKAQYGILSAIVSEIATSSGKEGTTKVALWSRFSNHFNLGSAKDLPSIKFDEAKAYLENLKADYARGFTLAIVKKDDLLALGYDSETKMFAVKALEQPVKSLPVPQPVMEIPNNMAMISITKLAELEKFSVTNERYFRQLPPKRTNVKEMLECLDVGMNLITDALDDLVFENKNIDRAVDKILKGLLAMRRYQPKHMQADYCG